MMMKRLRNTRGYTLVELLVAIALTGILFVVTWVMFASSSDVLGEVDSLTQTTDRLRFSMERVRTDIQMAGSMSTTNAATDVWVQPPETAWRVQGIYAYQGWQDDRSIMDADIANRNPNVSFDGFVLAGAYDNPLTFEIANIPVTLDSGTIAANAQGLEKLHVPDPFRTDPSYPVAFNNFSDYDAINFQWSTRAIRLMDSSGFMQFVRIARALESGDISTLPSGNSAISVQFDTADHPPQARGGTPFGLDVSAESDRAYVASLVDVFWYHVRQDPDDPINYQLVRERLCAPKAFGDAGNDYANWNPANATLPHTDCPGGVNEVVVVADRVVDFQIWFDCATAALQPQLNAAWSNSWLPPDNSANCMQVVSNPTTELARTAHVRMTLRADSERPNQAHLQFEDALGNTCDPANAGACDPAAFPGGRLRTFDVVPGLQGSVPVVTLQSTVSLPNFVYR